MLKFSIVTPSFNQAMFLKQTIDSVLSQKNVDVEYFVHDGGSIDNSREIIQEYNLRLAGWYSESDEGQTDAIVQGWQKASGDILAWLNSDDYYLPTALAKVKRVFESTPDTLIVIGKALMVDESGKVYSYKAALPFDLQKMFLGGSIPGQPSVFVHRRLVDRIGFPDTSLHYAFDWEYWIRAALFAEPSQIYCIDEPLSVMRIWSGTKTHMGIEKFCIEQRRVLVSLFVGRKLPSPLQVMRDDSIASMYVKQAFLEWQAGRSRDARQSLKTAIQISPSILSKPVHYNSLGLRLRCYIPYPFYRRVQMLWGRVRSISA